MAKTSGGIRGQITSKYLKESRLEIFALKNDIEYASKYGVKSIGTNGGYVAVSKNRKNESLTDKNGNLTNFGKEIFASEAMARDGWRIKLNNDYATVTGKKMPEGLANMKVFEIKSPVAKTATFEKNIKYALQKAEKDGKTQVVALYMGKETVGKVHRKHVREAINLYSSKNTHRFEKIVVVDSKGKTWVSRKSCGLRINLC